MANDWEIADRISDRIVDVIKEELVAMQHGGQVDVIQLLAGQFLAFCALEQTIPPEIRCIEPPELVLATQAIHKCLSEMIELKAGS